MNGYRPLRFKLTLSFIVLILCINFTINAQAPTTTANDQIPNYNGIFSYGVNSGYYGAHWPDTAIAGLARNIGVHTYRLGLFDYFLSKYGNTISVSNYNYYKNSDQFTNLAVFLNGASALHTDSTIYNYPPATYANPVLQYSNGFKNLYLNIWNTDGSVNMNNFYAGYVYNVVKNYGDKMTYYEVWNEPDAYQGLGGTYSKGQPGNWYQYPPAPQDLYNLHCPIYNYIRMMRITYEIVHHYYPNSYVTTGGLGYPNFLDLCLRYTDNPVDGSINPQYPKAGGAYFDILSFHNYPLYALKAWNNNINNFTYSRFSDACLNVFSIAYNGFKSELYKYGYGTKYPAKYFICTETNISDTTDYTDHNLYGSFEMQRNYLMKVMVLSQKLDLKQTYIFSLSNIYDLPNSAKNNFGLNAYMGLYYNITNQTSVSQTKLTQEGIAFKTMSNLLFNYSYDSIATKSLNLNNSVDGGAFKNSKTGKYRYILWAKTKTDLSEQANYVYNFPNGLKGLKTNIYNWNSSQYGLNPSINSSKSILLTGAPVIFETSDSIHSYLNANAGPYRIDTLPSSTLLDGSSSNDSIGNITQYKWSKISGPAGDIIQNPNSSQTRVNFIQTGLYIYQLMVGDNKANTSTSLVQVTVLPQIPPIQAIINTNASVIIPNLDTLNASRSLVSNGGSIQTYYWSQISGPSGDSIYAARSPSTKINFTKNGSYTFKLVISDNRGNLDSAVVTINVAGDITKPIQNLNILSIPLISQSKIYPNPATSFTNLLLDNSYTGSISIAIYDVLGRLFLSEQSVKTAQVFTTNINLTSLSPGNYLLVVSTNSSRQTFILEKN